MKRSRFTSRKDKRYPRVGLGKEVPHVKPSYSRPRVYYNSARKLCWAGSRQVAVAWCQGFSMYPQPTAALLRPKEARGFSANTRR